MAKRILSQRNTKSSKTTARILQFRKREPEPQLPPNKACEYTDGELHCILQDLIDAGHKYHVEFNLTAWRDYWETKGKAH